MREEILRLRADGRTYNQIKEELGCSLSTISYHCGVGQKTKTLTRTRNRKSRKLAYVQEYKQGKACADCKEEYPYWILEFDHLRDKVANVAFMCNSSKYSLSDVKEELKKCDVVCANCHKHRTWARLVRRYGDAMDVSEYYGE